MPATSSSSPPAVRPPGKSRAELLAWLRAQLGEAGVPAPEAEARALAQAALAEPPERFFARLGEAVPESALVRLEDWLVRRRGGEPLGLILGEVEFFGLKLEVRPGVFLPRPETEGLVALALETIASRRAPRVLDVGTGSGAIALAIQHARPDAEVHATDTSPKALALAEKNARRLGLFVTFHRGSRTAGLSGFDLLVSNPPYLPEAYRASAPPELAHEPETALYAGEEGLDVARPLVREALVALRPGGVLLLELDPTNAARLARELVALGYQRVCTLPDLASRPRYLLAHAPAPEAAGELGLAEHEEGRPAVGADPGGSATG